MDSSAYLLKMGSQESAWNLAIHQFYWLVIAISIPNQLKQRMLCSFQKYWSMFWPFAG